MNSLRCFLAVTLLAMVSVGTVFAQATGDYGSAGTGNWGTDGTNWVVCVTPGTWADATAAPAVPAQTTNVWIRSGHTVTVEVSPKVCNNLTVESGAVLYTNSVVTSPRYLRPYGTTITNNGTFGGTSDGLGINLQTADQTITLTGNGYYGVSRVQPIQPGQRIIFDANVNINYAGGSGTGSTGLYANNQDNTTFTINAGKTVTMARYSYIAVHTSSGSSAGNANFTFNIYGTLTTGNLAHINLNNTAGKTSTLTVYSGGTINLGDSANIRADVSGPIYAIAVNNGGTFTAGGSGMIGLGAATTTVNGTFDFGGSILTTRSLGTASVGGTLRYKDSTFSTAGTITLNSGSTVEYYGSSPFNLGPTPTLYENLWISNSSGIALSGNVTVNGVLTLQGGNVTTGINTLALSPTGSVSRTSGHIVGTLQKSIPTGTGVVRSFEIGSGSDYTPVDLTFASVGTAGDLSASTAALDHPNLASSSIDPTKSANRYWTLNNSGVGFSTYDATFNFVSGDLDPSAVPGSFIAEKYSGGLWSGLTEGTRTSTSTQITGATAFSDFAVGDSLIVPVPGFQLSSSTLLFGNVIVGGSKVDSVFVTNTGAATLNITSVVSSNSPVFSVVPTSASVAVGDSAKFTVTFTPAAPGPATSDIVFTHNAAGSPNTVVASGTGIPANAVFSVNPAGLSFGPVEVGQSKVDSAFVKNEGGAALNISSALSDNVVYTVVPGSAVIGSFDSAKFTITFSPTAGGAANGNIVFAHDAPGTPDTVTATGTGFIRQVVQSNGTGGGDWANPSTWQGSAVPSDVDSVVILGLDTVYVNTNAACGGLTVNTNGRLVMTDTLSDGVGVTKATTVGGTMVVMLPTGAFTKTGAVTFQNGSWYRHAVNNGTIPLATWNAGSTCEVTGYVSGSKPGNSNQNFYHFIWNCPGQTSNVDLAMSGNTIGGDFTVNSTNTVRVYLTSPAGYTSPITINGNVIMTAGQFSSNGSGSAANIEVTTHGNIVITGGIFSVSRGSGTDVMWYLHGNFSVTNATLQNSGGATRVQKLVFANAGTQTITLTNVTYGTGTAPFTMQVQGGASLEMGANVVTSSNTGSFIVLAGATLASGHPGGISGNIQSTGTSNGGGNSFSTDANYTFNGSASQVTSLLLPTTVNNLTIDNASNVVLSDSTLVNDTLSVLSGDLDLNGNVITLGPAAVLSESAGNTVTGTSGFITTTRMLTAPSGTTDIAGLGVMIGSAVDLGSTVLTRGHVVQAGTGSTGIRRYFDITPTTNTGLNATLVYKYDESELGVVPEASLLLFKSTDNGATWSSGSGTVNTSTNSIALSGVNDLSRWTAAGTGTVTVGVPVAGGWNIVSLPVSAPVPDDSVKHLWVNSVNPYSFAFVGGYVQTYTMANGPGYWIKSIAAYTQNITGTLRDTLTIWVNPGWNMIGSISTSIDTSAAHVTPTPANLRASNFFKYSNGYVVATTIDPGLGYWVKANPPGGTFFLHATGPAGKAASETPATAARRSIEDLHSITILDANGGMQTLYFGVDANGEIPVAMFAMPPAPPEGSFDARFASSEGGLMVQTHAEQLENVRDLPITIQSSAYPLTVSWKVNGTASSYELSIGSTTHPVRGEGTLKIINSRVQQLMLKVTGEGGVPKEFALSQNYPNPFNPTTNIKYGLPVDSRVTMEIYNVIGQRVRTLVSDVQVAGYHVAEWDGTGNAGQQLASGVYFLQMSAKGVNGKSFNEVRKLMMMK